MRKRPWLTTLEREVLTAVSQVSEDAYALTVRAQIQKTKGEYIRLGPIYTAFHRLEDKGCLTSWSSPGGPERGGYDKWNYGLQEVGRISLRNPEWNPNPELPDPSPGGTTSFSLPDRSFHAEFDLCCHGVFRNREKSPVATRLKCISRVAAVYDRRFYGAS